jgi:uncharacterized protein (TIGR02246 family)
MKIVARARPPDGLKAAWSVVFGLLCAAALESPPAHASSAAQCAPLTEVEAAGLFQRWNTALAESKLVQLVDFYRDDAEFAAHVGDMPRRGRPAILAYYTSLLPRHPQAFATSRTVETGCNVATESGMIVYRITGRRKGTRMLLGGSYVTQYRFDDGVWRIDRHILGARPIAARQLSLTRPQSHRR